MQGYGRYFGAKAAQTDGHREDACSKFTRDGEKGWPLPVPKGEGKREDKKTLKLWKKNGHKNMWQKSAYTYKQRCIPISLHPFIIGHQYFSSSGNFAAYIGMSWLHYFVVPVSKKNIHTTRPPSVFLVL